jgi:hypothetical protein
LVTDKKIITAPDLDYSRAFKIMLIDFDWADITAIAEAIKKLPIPVTLFLYGSNDKNIIWAISQAKQCNSVLLNMNNQGSCETLKGFLMAEPNIYTYGNHELDNLFQRKVIDTMSWLAIQYQHYIEANNDLET